MERWEIEEISLRDASVLLRPTFGLIAPQATGAGL
jgi:hypothetical protein